MRKRLFSMFLAIVLLLTLGVPALAEGTPVMSQNSVTIQVGDVYQLNVMVNGVTVQANAWGSSDTSVAVVSSTGAVTGKAAGSAVITAMVQGNSVECLVSVVKRSTSATNRYNVLVLDTSTSMVGKPLEREKEAVKRFCKTVLSSDGKNYVAMVTFDTSARVVCNFTDNPGMLNQCIDRVTTSDGTNMEAGLQTAGQLLANIPDGTNMMKNVILCSDGLPRTGAKLASGRYKAKDSAYYLFANAAYKTDAALKNQKYFIYALGFFHKSSGNKLAFGKRLMKDLASKDKYYVVTETKDIDHVFDDIANRITKTSINKSYVTLYVGETETLKAQVNGVTKKAAWKSSKPSVASVNKSGKVTAKKPGKTTITGKVNGKSATCVVTVKEKKKKPASKPRIKVSQTKATVYVRKSIKLKADVKGKSKKVSWTSSNKAVATVNKNGKVTGKKAGKVTITAKANGVRSACVVTVKIKHPTYSQYLMMKPAKSIFGKMVDESGIIMKVNEGADIEKCAVYMYKDSYGYWHAAVACRGTGIYSARLVAYLARNGKVLYSDGYRAKVNGKDYWLNTFSMYRDYDGIWSMNGRYGDIKNNFYDAYGRETPVKSVSADKKNMRIFYNKTKMINWLKK